MSVENSIDGARIELFSPTTQSWEIYPSRLQSLFRHKVTLQLL
jgi:hypothetical protein